MEFSVEFGGSPPSGVEAALETDGRFVVEPGRRSTICERGRCAVGFSITAERRGAGSLDRLWARWRGPFGLVWKQRVWRLDHGVTVTPDLWSVREEAVRLFSRTALLGVKVQPDSGAGSEFHALREFHTGMDRRAIDWKQSARHASLLAKEFRAERNHPVLLVLDSGRSMSEPIAGAPRIDHAIVGALLLAFAGLRLGDRVGLFSFDSRPRLSTGVTSGAGAFALLQRLASSIDYSTEETNYTLGLLQVSASLERRSLVVVFTEFTDTTSAELMIENVGRLLQRHVVLFVAFRDEELERIAQAEPLTADDVARAVVAGALLRTRGSVISRLRRLGAKIVDTPADRVGPALLNAYLDVKRRELI